MSKNNILNFQTDNINKLKNIYIRMPTHIINPFVVLDRIIINQYIVSPNMKLLVDHRVTNGKTLQMYSSQFHKDIMYEENGMVWIKLFPDLSTTYEHLNGNLYNDMNHWHIEIQVELLNEVEASIEYID
jgi:hypothetical protein